MFCFVCVWNWDKSNNKPGLDDYAFILILAMVFITIDTQLAHYAKFTTFVKADERILRFNNPLKLSTVCYKHNIPINFVNQQQRERVLKAMPRRIHQNNCSMAMTLWNIWFN